MFGWRKNKKNSRDEQAYIQMNQTPSAPVVRKVPELATYLFKATGNREYQQDAAWVSPTKILASNKVTRAFAIVCDGMGGMADGEKASQTAIEMMKNGFHSIEKVPEVDIPSFFRQGILSTDQVVSQNLPGAGTTLVAAIVEDNRLYWGSAGDSRLYIIRGNQIRQVTQDHNYALILQERVAAGLMTQQEAMAQRQREALISFIGMGGVKRMDINTKPFHMQYGDVVMLCSDGITKTLSDEQIKNILIATAVRPEKKAEALVEAATHANSHSQDNTSVALIVYRERELKKH